jgi:hypothetical protein
MMTSLRSGQARRSVAGYFQDQLVQELRRKTVTATGYPAPKITESGQLPKGVTFSSATGTLSGTPKAGTEGSYAITITAKNSSGTATQNFTLTVS